MLEEINRQDPDNKKTLLLHSCCAVCSAWVVKYLSRYFDLTIYFNNSNIYPQGEYIKRLKELHKLIAKSDLRIEIVTEEYDETYQLDYFDLREEREGGKRCEACISRRLKSAYDYAENHDFDYFTSVMSASRNKDANLLNQIGRELQKNRKTKYLISDFKKDDGTLKAARIVEEYGIYRQNYCGCVYSYRKPPGWTLDYLPNQNVFLFQREDMFRVNTDTTLLGEFARAEENEIVLDCGCNNGALMLYLSRGKFKELIGIDIFAEALEVAQINMELNGVENYRLLNMDISDFKETVDVIVCNPPYFNFDNEQNKNNNTYLEKSRHLDKEGLLEFFRAFKRILKPQGRIYLVYRYEEWPKIKTLIKESGFVVENYQEIFDERSEKYTTVLAEMSQAIA